MIRIENIRLEDINNGVDLHKLICHDRARRYAILHIDVLPMTFLLSWRSDTIEPSLCLVEDRLWVGIDQRVVAVNISDGYVCLSFVLDSNLTNLQVHRDLVIVLFETGVTVFNLDGSIRFYTHTPNIPASGWLDGDQLVIKMISNDSVSYRI